MKPLKGHFERDAYLQWLIPGSILLIGFISALVGLCAFPAIRTVRIDSCLDSGGSYDYELDRCDHERSHPVP